MKKLYIALIGSILLMAGCSQVPEHSAQLETQRVVKCNFAGGPFKNAVGNIIAAGGADCRFIRDGSDSALANSHLQESVPNGRGGYEWRTLSSSLGKKWTLPARVNDAWHLFDDLNASGVCKTGTYRTYVTVKWPLSGTQNIIGWGSAPKRINC